MFSKETKIAFQESLGREFLGKNQPSNVNFTINCRPGWGGVGERAFKMEHCHRYCSKGLGQGRKCSDLGKHSHPQPDTMWLLFRVLSYNYILSESPLPFSLDLGATKKIWFIILLLGWLTRKKAFWSKWFRPVALIVTSSSVSYCILLIYS